ncbi:MAG: nitric oxide reductase NorD protein [Polaribacter sp.]|jgi:nitric oxide reductase NorD protein
MCYSNAVISSEALSPAQMFFIGLIEDARVEYKSIQDFSGLKKLWLSLLAEKQEETASNYRAGSFQIAFQYFLLFG